MIAGTDDVESLAGHTHMTFGYDTIWAAALALQEAHTQLQQLGNYLDSFPLASYHAK